MENHSTSKNQVVLVLENPETKFVYERDQLLKFEYFQMLLQPSFMESQQSEIKLKELEPKIFQLVSAYIHEKEVHINLDNSIELYQMADQLLLGGLKQKCIVFMKQNLNTQNKITFLQFALLHKESSLEQQCLYSIKQDKNWVTDYLLNADTVYPEAFEKLISQMTLQELKTEVRQGSGYRKIIDILLLAQVDDKSSAPLYETMLQQVLKNDINVNYTFETKDKQLFTPLSYAAKHNLTNMALYLAPKVDNYSNGVNYYYSTNSYYSNSSQNTGTALFYAVQNNNLTLVNAILTIKGVDVSRASSEDFLPIKKAFEMQNLELVKLLLENKATINNTLKLNQCSYGCYFEAAAANNWVNMLELFFQQNRKPNYSNKPYQLALENTCPEAAAVLLKWQPDLSINNGNALHALALSKNASQFVPVFEGLKLDYTKLFVKYGYGTGLPIHCAMEAGNWPVTQYFIDKGAFDAFTMSNDTFMKHRDDTPLDTACDKGLRDFVLKTIHYLLDSRCPHNPMLKNELLNWAWLRQYHEIVNILVVKGHADVNQLTTNQNNHENNSFLHQAVIQKRLEVVKFLVAHRANLNIQNEALRTPLHEAAVRGNSHFYILEHLILHNANVGLKDVKGKTPLHDACEQNHYFPAQWLINKKANIDEPDNDLQTPLHKAAIKGNGTIVGLLTKAGANITLWDKNGKTAANLALQNNTKSQQAIVEHLDEEACRLQ